MNYRILDRAGTLCRTYLKSICMLTNGDAGHVYGCIPNGAIGISIITNGDCSFRQDMEWVQQPRLFVYGLIRKVQWHKISPAYREITIVFKPHLLQLFMNERISALPEHAAISLYDLFDRKRTDELYDTLCRTTTDEEIGNAVECFLKSTLRAGRPDKRIGAAHDMICDGKLRNVGEISDALNISSTTLRNLFRDNVGITPKELIKVRRINEAFRTREHRQHSLTSLAYELGYFDQAHFIHDFRDVTGITPKEYFHNPKLTFDFYNLSRWDQDSFV